MVFVGEILIGAERMFFIDLHRSTERKVRAAKADRGLEATFLTVYISARTHRITMYYYLSFLRPPPSQVSLGSSLTITPQIANDLRTERYHDSHDIYYSWAPESTPNLASSTQPRQITRPVKLTTWRENNAYRELAIPPPQGIKEGQKYRLVLLAQPQGMPHVINFATEGSIPLPVMSMPILFSSRSRTAVSKQEQVERIYRLPTSAQSAAFLSIIEQTSFDLDKVSTFNCNQWPQLMRARKYGIAGSVLVHGSRMLCVNPTELRLLHSKRTSEPCLPPRSVIS